MIICVKCKKEMICTKTGTSAIWYGHHVYPADKFECKKCGIIVLNTTENAYHSDNTDRLFKEGALDMTGEEENEDTAN